MCKIAYSLDINLREEHRWSSADICFLEPYQYAIDGMGPIGVKPSDQSEYILRHSLMERAALLAMILAQLSPKNIKKEDRFPGNVLQEKNTIRADHRLDSASIALK